MIELLTAGIGGATTALAFTIGNIVGWKRRERHHPRFEEVCQCNHLSSYHDSGGCHWIGQGDCIKYDAYGREVQWLVLSCACVRYVGPNSSYVPELETK